MFLYKVIPFNSPHISDSILERNIFVNVDYSTVAIGTIASGLRKKENRRLFEEGFRTMISTLQPKAIIIYGSENYAVIQEAKDKGILIISFESKTSLAFKQRGRKQP